MEAAATLVEAPDGTPPNRFRAAEKAFKAYRDGRPTDPRLMERVLDFASRSPATAVAEEVVVADGAPEWLRTARIYSIRGVDGFRFIRCPFDHERQLRLARLPWRLPWLLASAPNARMPGTINHTIRGRDRPPFAPGFLLYTRYYVFMYFTPAFLPSWADAVLRIR